MSKKCDKCGNTIKASAPEWYLAGYGEILTLCSRECHRAARNAARDTITPPAPKPEPKDPNQTEAFN